MEILKEAATSALDKAKDELKRNAKILKGLETRFFVLPAGSLNAFNLTNLKKLKSAYDLKDEEFATLFNNELPTYITHLRQVDPIAYNYVPTFVSKLNSPRVQLFVEELNKNIKEKLSIDQRNWFFNNLFSETSPVGVFLQDIQYTAGKRFDFVNIKEYKYFKNILQTFNPTNCKNKDLIDLIKTKTINKLDQIVEYIETTAKPYLDFYIDVSNTMIRMLEAILLRLKNQNPFPDTQNVIKKFKDIQNSVMDKQNDLYEVSKSLSFFGIGAIWKTKEEIQTAETDLLTFFNYLSKNDISQINRDFIQNTINKDIYYLVKDYIKIAKPVRFEELFRSISKELKEANANIYNKQYTDFSIFNPNLINKALTKLYLAKETVLINFIQSQKVNNQIFLLNIFKRILKRDISPDDYIEFIKVFENIKRKESFTNLWGVYNLDHISFPTISKPKPAAEYTFEIVRKLNDMEQIVHSDFATVDISPELAPKLLDKIKSNKFSAIKIKMVKAFSGLLATVFTSIPNKYQPTYENFETRYSINPQFAIHLKQFLEVIDAASSSEYITVSDATFIKLKNLMDDNIDLLPKIGYSSIDDFKADLDFFFLAFSNMSNDSWINKNIHEIKNKLARINATLMIFKSKSAIKEFKTLNNEILSIRDIAGKTDIPNPETFIDSLKHPSLYLLDGFSPFKNFSFHVLQPKDFRHLIIGIETDCCQALGGAGWEAARDSFINPLAGVIYLNYNDDLVAQSYFHFVPNQGFILDNIEATSLISKFKNNEVEKAYAALAAFSKDKFKFPLFALGIPYTKINMSLFAKEPLKDDPRFFAVDDPYSDFNKEKEFVNLLSPTFNDSNAPSQSNISKPLTFSPFQNIKASINIFNNLVRFSF